MSTALLIKIKKTHLSGLIAFAVSGSFAIFAWWFVRRVYRKGNDDQAPDTTDIHQRIYPISYGRAPFDLRSKLSEKSMSMRSRGSFLTKRSANHTLSFSRDGGSTCATYKLPELSSATDCGRIGLLTLTIIIEQLEDCMHRMHEEKYRFADQNSDSCCTVFIAELQGFLETSYMLLERYKRVFIQNAPADASEFGSLNYESDDDTASFVSALEQVDFSELELQMMSNFHRPLYRGQLKELSDGKIMCKSLRTELMHCASDVEYLGKLGCIRQGFNLFCSKDGPVQWLKNAGTSLASEILTCLGYPTTEFENAFTALINYLQDSRVPANRSQLADELFNKGIQTLNFYDIVFDRLLLDALENLGNPPSSILVLTRNNWISNNFKRSALDSAVWTLLTAKRKLLQYPDGFFAYYYRVVETVAPALAWGFLGPEESTIRLCEALRDELMLFVRNLFTFSDKGEDQAEDTDTLNSSLWSIQESVNDRINGIIEAEDDDDDDDATITAEDVSESFQIVDTLSDDYYGLRFTNIEDLLKDIYTSMGVLERRLRRHIMQFSEDNELEARVSLGVSLAQPPLVFETFM